MTDTRNLKIEIGHRSIIFAILFILSLKFLVVIQSILITLFISFLLSTAIFPLVNALHRFRIPRALSTAVILVLLVVGVSLIFASIMPLVISQTNAFLIRFPDLLDQLGSYSIDSSVLTSQISNLSGNILRLAFDTFSVGVMLMTILVITFILSKSAPT